MLSREAMGALALAILWVNTLLVALAAARAAGKLRAIARGLGRIDRGTVLRGDGPDRALASFDVDQIGRLGGGSAPTIFFHDRARACRVHGGRVALAGGEEVDVAATDDADVWLDASRLSRAASPPDAGFEAACGEARKARGYARALAARVEEGADVFVAAGGAEARRPRLVATFDPRAWIARRVTLAYAFAVAEVVVAAGCTAVALRPPVFGAVSTAGAAAAFVFFLLVQPAGTAVRDALLPPSRAPRRDAWTGRAA